jgi:hypothetical protein
MKQNAFASPRVCGGPYVGSLNLGTWLAMGGSLGERGREVKAGLARTGVQTSNQFGQLVPGTVKERELCVPSVKTLVP